MIKSIEYSRIGYSDGFVLIKLSDIDFAKDIFNQNYIMYKWFHKHLRLDIIIDNTKFILKQFGILTRKRLAEVITDSSTRTKHLLVIASWNRNHTILGIVGNSLLTSAANEENYKIYIDDDGNYTLTHPAVLYSKIVANNENVVNDSPVTTSSPLEVWTNGLFEIYSSLQEARNVKNHLVAMELYKVSLSRLVRGLEIFLKEKFIELGYFIIPNYQRLIKYFKNSDQEKVESKIDELKRKKIINIIPVIFRDFPKSISFQNFDNAGKIYNDVFGIRFRDIPLVWDKMITDIKFIIQLRHIDTHTNDFPMYRELVSGSSLNENFVLTTAQTFDAFVKNLEKHITNKIEEEFYFFR